jgi:hypothetical protein
VLILLYLRQSFQWVKAGSARHNQTMANTKSDKKATTKKSKIDKLEKFELPEKKQKGVVGSGPKTIKYN